MSSLKGIGKPPKEEIFREEEQRYHFVKERVNIKIKNNRTSNSTRRIVKEQGGNADTSLDGILHKNRNVLSGNYTPSHR